MSQLSKKMQVSRTIVLIIIATLGGLCIANAQVVSFPEDDINTQFGVFVDPTFTDKGEQFGVFATMVMHWGYVGASASNYSNLNGIGYSDLVGELGVNFHLFQFEPVRYYAGFRGGRLWRDAGGYPLAGGVVGFDWRVSRRDAEVDVFVGIKLWTDYREDQKNQFYGDSDAYERGFITNNPLLQENGAFTVSFSF